jgi:hypothetical protein
MLTMDKLLYKVNQTHTHTHTHTHRSLNQETEEDLKIVELFKYVADYSKKLEHTKIELLGLKR